MSEKFERKILGLHFKNNRLKELQEKANSKGLRGDEVFELIHLDRYELKQQLKEVNELLDNIDEYSVLKDVGEAIRIHKEKYNQKR